MSGISGMGTPDFSGYAKKTGANIEESLQGKISGEPAEENHLITENQAAAELETAKLLDIERKKVEKKEENDAEEIIEKTIVDEVSEADDVEEVAPPTKEELDMIDDMKKTIKKQSFKVARKVNKSAFNYMSKKKGWIIEDMDKEAEEFFTIRIPKVMAKELSGILNQALGLDLDEDDINVA